MNLSSLSHQRCYICDNSVVSEVNNVFEVLTGHSQTPVHLFLEKFVGHSLSSRTEPNFSDLLCQECIDKFNEYDLAVLTAQRLQHEVLECFNATINKYDEFKLEVVEPDDSIGFDQIGSYGDGVIVIKGEKADGYEDCSYLDSSYERMRKVNVAKKRIRKKKLKVERLDRDVSENWSLLEVVEKKCKRLFKCQQCTMEFDDKSQYREHISSHDIANKEMHVCDVCGQTYKSKTALDIHVGLHKGVSPHKCEVRNFPCRLPIYLQTEQNSLGLWQEIHSEGCTSQTHAHSYWRTSISGNSTAKSRHSVRIFQISRFSSVTNVASNSFTTRPSICINWRTTISEKRNARSADWSYDRILI